MLMWQVLLWIQAFNKLAVVTNEHIAKGHLAYAKRYVPPAPTPAAARSKEEYYATYPIRSRLQALSSASEDTSSGGHWGTWEDLEPEVQQKLREDAGVATCTETGEGAIPGHVSVLSWFWASFTSS